MKIEILHIAGCPNSDEVGIRLRSAVEAAGVTGVDMVSTVLRTSEEAARALFAGSPTILIDGVDAFPNAARTSDLACRIYPTDTGIAGLPTAEELTGVLRERSSGAGS